MIVLIDVANRGAEVDALWQNLQTTSTNSALSIRPQQISTNRFLALAFPLAVVPQALQGFFPQITSAATLTNGSGPYTEILLGRLNSWLVAGTRNSDLEQVCSTINEHRKSPSFIDRYGTNHPVILPRPLLYAWVNAQSLLGVVSRNYPLPAAGTATIAEDISADMLVKATGLGKARTLFFSLEAEPQGFLYQMTWAVPENDREAILRLLSVEGKACSPPAFVPDDTAEFDRWRVDGRKAWATMQEIFATISPHWTNSVSLILETANAAARLKDPTFDIHTNLFGNLGDDLLIIEKPPRDPSPTAIDSPPTLYLFGSPNPPQLANALGSIFIFLDRAAEKPVEREVAGHLIRSVPLPSTLLSAGSLPLTGSAPRRLHYAPTRGYVALTTDGSFLEEFLQSTNPPVSNMLAQADFPLALKKVIDSESGLFGFNNRLSFMRAVWPVTRTSTNAVAQVPLGFNYGFLPGLIGIVLPEEATKWFDLRLLPPFNSVEKYFHYTVYGGASNTNGITWKVFEPAPPGLQ